MQRGHGQGLGVATRAEAAVPEGGCVTAAEGRVLLARVGGTIVAYRNACLHKGARLHTGVVRDGVLTCPAHLWRYRLADGTCLNAEGTLQRLPCRVLDGQVEVDLPAEDSASLREQLLAHARTWRRDGGQEAT